MAGNSRSAALRRLIFGGGDASPTPANAITLGGSPITLGGSYVVLGA